MACLDKKELGKIVDNVKRQKLIFSNFCKNRIDQSYKQVVYKQVVYKQVVYKQVVYKQVVMSGLDEVC